EAEGTDAPAGPAPEEPAEEDEFLAGQGEEGVRLGNKVYRDWTAADHVFRQFAGRAKAESARRKELEADRDRLSAELAQARTVVPAQVFSPVPLVVPAPVPKRLSEQFTEEEIDRMIAEKSPAAAFKHITDLFESEVGRLVAEQTRDLEPIVNRARAVDAGAALFERASDLRDAQGNRLIPELDPEDPRSDLVVAQWRRNLEDSALAPISFTDAGIQLALTQVRLEAASQPQPASPKPAPSGRASKTLQSMGSSSRTPTETPGPTRPVNLEEAARLAVLARQHPVFGVTVER
ncbi:MAG: hypothetical protein ACRDGM_18195, partial [bacterium]